jgi:hypothetical protein
LLEEEECKKSKHYEYFSKKYLKKFKTPETEKPSGKIENKGQH